MELLNNGKKMTAFEKLIFLKSITYNFVIPKNAMIQQANHGV